jgi:hypothetical protein
MDFSICDTCVISHIENCHTCFGFGLTLDGTIISAAEAIEAMMQSKPMQSLPCPECGSTHRGLPETAR